MQETRYPGNDGEMQQLRETFIANTEAALGNKMDTRLEELEKEGHELVGRTPLTMPQALIEQIRRCEALLNGEGTRMNKAALRTAIQEGRDSLNKFHKLKKRVVRSYEALQNFK